MKHTGGFIVIGLVVAIVAVTYAITRPPQLQVEVTAAEPPLTYEDQSEAPRLLEKDQSVELGNQDAEEIDWSQVDWKRRLTRMQFYVTRQGGTERAFRNAYWKNKRPGVYRCVCCELPLFDSQTKFESGTGWPSFYAPIADDAVTEHQDNTLFMQRVEIRCRRCDAHLGHVFADGPEPTGLRYCMNSAAMRFVAADGENKDAKQTPRNEEENE